MNLTRLLALAALLAAHPLTADAIPIPPAGAALSRVLQLHTPRTSDMPHRLRSLVRGLAARVPALAPTPREDREDIFLARSLEDTVFASARDIIIQDGALWRRDVYLENV